LKVKMIEHVIAERLDLDPIYNDGVYEVDDTFAAELIRLGRATQAEVQVQQSKTKQYEGARR